MSNLEPANAEFALESTSVAQFEATNIHVQSITIRLSIILKIISDKYRSHHLQQSCGKSQIDHVLGRNILPAIAQDQTQASCANPSQRLAYAENRNIRTIKAKCEPGYCNLQHVIDPTLNEHNYQENRHFEILVCLLINIFPNAPGNVERLSHYGWEDRHLVLEM